MSFLGTGFGAGFGQGFSRSFSQAQAEKADRERDAFRIMLDSYTKRKGERDKYEQEDAKRIAQAKQIAKREPDIPEGAWTYIYEDLEAGLSPDYSIKRLKEGKFGALTPTEMPAGQVDKTPDASRTPSEARTDDPIQLLDQGTAQAPNASPEAPERVEGKPAQGNLVNKVNDFLRNLKENKNVKTREKAIQRIAEMNGISPQQVEEMLQGMPEREAPQHTTGWTPSKPPETPDYAGDKWATVKGRLDIMEPKEQNAQLAKSSDKLRTEIAPLNEANNTFVALIRDAADVKEIVSGENGRAVLNQVTATGAQFMDNVQKTIQAVGQMVGSDNAADLSAFIQQEEAAISRLEASGAVEDVATQATLLQMKTNLMAYKLGMVYQQSGRSFAEAEREMFREIAQSGNTPEKFINNMSILLTREQQKLDGTYNNKVAENAYDLVAYEHLSKQPFGVRSITETIQADPEISAVMESFGTPTFQDSPRQVVEEEMPQSGPVPTGTFTPDGRPLYKLPDGRIVAPKAQQ